MVLFTARARANAKEMIENEHLPTSLGWSKPAEEITLADILFVTEALGNFTSLYSTAVITPQADTVAKRAGHWGVPM